MAEQVSLSGIRAVVFDKDGTLIDVHRTWGLAIGGAPRDLVDDPTRRAEAAAAIGVDLDTHELAVDAPVIAASNDQRVSILFPTLEVDLSGFSQSSRSGCSPTPMAPSHHYQGRSTRSTKGPWSSFQSVLVWRSSSAASTGQGSGSTDERTASGIRHSWRSPDS